MKKLTKLNAEQEALMPVVRDEWIRRCDSGGEMDREAVKVGINWMYDLAKQPHPKFCFVSSPFAMQIAANIFSNGKVYSAVRSAVYSAVDSAVRSAVRSAVYSAVDSAVGSAVYSAVDSAVGSAVRSAVDSAVGSAVYSAVDSAVDSAVRSAVRSAVYSAVGSAVGSAVDSAVDSAVGSAVRSAVDSAVGSAVDSAVDSAVYSAVDSAVYSAVNSAVGSAVDSAVGSAVGSAVNSAVDSAVGSAVGSAVRSAVYSAVYSAVDSAVGSAVYSAVGSAVRSAVGSAVYSAVDSAVYSAVDSAVGSAVYSAVDSAVRSAVGSAVGSAVRSAVYSAVGSAVYSAVDSAVDSAVYSAVGSAVDSAVRSAVGSAVGSAVRSAKLQWHYRFGWSGAYFYNWGAWADYFTRIGIIDSEVSTNFVNLLKANSFDAILTDSGWCIVCELPRYVKRDEQQRMHCTTGPAIEWSDAFKLYSINGVRFEEEMFNKVTGGSMTAKEILNIEVIDQRVVALKLRGVENLLTELNAEEIHKSERGNTLYALNDIFLDFPKAYFLKYSCPSTGRVYVDGVDPEIASNTKNADHCMAWKHSMTPEQYSAMPKENEA